MANGGVSPQRPAAGYHPPLLHKKTHGKALLPIEDKKNG